LIKCLFIQHLNGVDYLDRIVSGFHPSYTTTGTFPSLSSSSASRFDSVYSPVTFSSKETYLGLPQMKAYYDIELHFKFREEEEMETKFELGKVQNAMHTIVTSI
jgi:hypothetical protein